MRSVLVEAACVPIKILILERRGEGYFFRYASSKALGECYDSAMCESGLKNEPA